MLKEALAALEKGDMPRARDLLTRLLKTDQRNPRVWLYMSAVVETPKERIYCLKEVLRRDPNNAAALRGLSLAGALPPTETPRPAPLVKRPWQKSLAAAVTGAGQPPRSRQVLMLVGGLLGLALLVFVGLSSVRFLGARQAQAPRIPTVAVTVAPSITPTAAPTRPLVVGVTGTPVPLWMQLSATYTPTAIYVNTPHPRTEAYRSALRAYERGDWQGMQLYLEQVATEEPSAADVHYYLGEAQRLRGQYPQAIEAYNHAISLNSQFAPPYLGLARALAASQPKSELQIETRLQDALKYDPNLAEAYLELADLYVRKADAEQAFATLETGAPVLNQSPLFYALRARAHLLAGEPSQAVEDARQANALDVTRVESYLLLAEALQANGDLSGSIKPLETYVRYAGSDAQALLLLGRAGLAAGQFDQALSNFDRLLELDLASLAGTLARGELYLLREEGQPALDDFTAAVKLKGDSFEANLGKGRALLLLGYNGDAYMQISRTEGFARSDTEKAQVYYWRALALEGLKERDPSSGIAAMNDWKALLALPQDAYPPEWAAQAQKHLQALYTSTPTLRPSLTPSATQTPTATYTVKPSATLAATPTRTP